MAIIFSVTKQPNHYYYYCTFFTLVMISIAFSSVSSFQFQVGGNKGWTLPTSNDTESYDDWATKNRFQIGDSVYFEYKEDSVLVVDSDDYNDCIVSNPISKYEDGSTVIGFDRHGYYYFISGEPGHCKSGQKLIIDVMAESRVEKNREPSPSPSPPPSSSPKPNERGGGGGGGEPSSGWDSGEWGAPMMNSTMMLSVTSYFMTTLAVVLVILYMFM